MRRIGRLLRDRGLRRTGAGTVPLVLLLLAGLSSPGLAGTTGKLAGRVVDGQGQPLYGATVIIAGKPLGAFSDREGQYTILNIPPGTYQVAASYVGYQNVSVTDVVISADTTTKLDITLQETVLAMEEIVVQAGRPIVDVNLTSSRSTLSREEINKLPVQELQDVVNLQAGVVDGHFRGGRIGEVQYQVDGVSANNLHDNKSTLKLDRSVLQEVQVISGTFDAEYGQAMSGVVNAVLREGSDRFRWDAEAYLGDFLFAGNGDRIVDDPFRPLALRNLQATVSGPTTLPETVFLASVQHRETQEYVDAIHRFRPTDESDFEEKIFRPTGDGHDVALGWSREWTGLAKVTNTSLPGLKVSYEAIVNRIKARRMNWAYRYNPNGAPTQRTLAIVHGPNLTRAMGEKTFLELSARHVYFDYEDAVYDDAFDPRYDAAGQAISDAAYEPGAVLQGVDFTHFGLKTENWVLKSSLVSQVTPEHNLKSGIEVQLPEIKFGTDVYISGERNDLTRHVDELPRFPGPSTYKPILASVYGQDQMEWTDLMLRAGMRLDLFDARSSVPSDPRNPANSIDGAPPSPPKETTTKATLAPRLGVAYPITRDAGFHFAYGHFYQFPGLGEVFTNANYSILADLQAGEESSFGAFGNPDIKPEKTVQYEFGFKMAMTEQIGFDVSLFYKDIRDLLGVEFISTYNGAEYMRLTNVDFGNVTGFTIAFDQRDFGPLSTSIDYTWQRVQGNSSDPRETAVRSDNGEDPRPRLIPLNWDQRHTFNLTATLARPNDYTASAVLRIGSGQPYTPVIEEGHGFGLDANSGRKPSSAVLDLRVEKELGRIRPGLRTFMRVWNALDARFWNGSVFESTGSPYYSRFPTADEVALGDPTRFYPPRRVELGLAYAWESPEK